MKHPAFVTLGIPVGSDESEIKRAYARLLKDNRPDENPTGFQKINEAYKAALKWKPRDEALDSSASERDVHPIIPNDRADSDLATERVELPSIDTSETTVSLVAEDDFTIDVTAFNKQLIDEADGSDVKNFKIWFDAATRNWPLDLVPMIGRELVYRWREALPKISLGQFEIVAERCLFDDVLQGHESILISDLRRNIATQEASAERLRRHAILFGQPGRSQLCQHMAWTGRGEYAAWQTRLYARLLTSPYAYQYLQAAHYVPGAHKAIMRFLLHIDEGHLDALSPEIDETTIAFLQWSTAPRERTWPQVLLMSAVVVIALSALRHFYGPSQSRTPVKDATITRQAQTARPSFTPFDQAVGLHQKASRQIEEGRNLDALQTLNLILERFGKDTSGEMEQIIALAHYNKAHVFTLMGSDITALKIYDFVWDTFYRTNHKDVKPLVAMSQFNAGNIHRRLGNDPKLVSTAYTRVFSNYGDEADIRLREQCAKSRFALADYHNDIGQRDDAIRLAESLVIQYEKDSDPSITHYVVKARALLARVNETR
jgi:hypothetical protein